MLPQGDVMPGDIRSYWAAEHVMSGILAYYKNFKWYVVSSTSNMANLKMVGEIDV
jgi:hypothetical protein